MEKKHLRPYQGIIVFVVVILMLLFVAAPIQMNLGMLGVVITELMIAALGIIPALIFKADLREVFPVKVPKLRQIFGVCILWGGSLLVVVLVTLMIGYFFPEGLSEVSNSLQETFTSVPLIISFLIVAVSPAICEEILVRGFILSSFRSLKNKWIIAAIVGILFGIFHLDPYRFLPTAILGLTLSYIMLETGNILMPALFHFINNGFSTVTSFVTSNETVSVAADFNIPLISIGVYFILAAGAPFLLLAGARLLKNRELPYDFEAAAILRKKNRKGIWIAVAFTVALFITGFIITIIAISQTNFSELLQQYAVHN